MPLYEYVCVCGHKEEEVLIRFENQAVPCSVCKREMKRQLPDRFSFGFSSKSSLPPTAASKFNTHMREKNFRRKKAAFESMGKEVPNGYNVKARYFNMEDGGPRNYPKSTRKNQVVMTKAIKKQKAKIKGGK